MINSYIKYYDNPVHYYFLDDETYQFFNQFFEAVDSMSWESLESLKDDLGQYVYVSYYGDPINKEELIQLRDNKSFERNESFDQAIEMLILGRFDLFIEEKNLLIIFKWESDGFEVEIDLYLV